MTEPPADLASLHADLWARLDRGSRDHRASFHKGVVATCGANGPSARTVVLRSVDVGRRELVLHTDARAAKVEELRSDPRLAWVFWEPRTWTQLRVEAHATIHVGDELAHECWQQTTLWGRRFYLSNAAPGTVLETPGSGLPAGLEGRQPEPEESAAGIENFAVVVARARAMDWLWLDRQGNRRARWEYAEDGVARGKWLVP